MDRCELAFQYRKERYNCAQAVAAAFTDLLETTPEALFTAVSGFGGGVGGCHEEICGALSGGVYVLSRLYADPADRAGHKTVYPKVREFRRRFEETFGHIRCGQLRTAAPGATEATPAAFRLGAHSHCDIMVVTAVEILEQMLAEEAA